MNISILGRGPLAEPLALLAERAGHSVRRLTTAEPAQASDMGRLAILADTREALAPMLAQIAPAGARDIVFVDATTPSQDDRGRSADQRGGSDDASFDAALPGSRVVRAFASVPADALRAVVDAPPSQPGERLGVPLAGDDAQARGVVGEFMRSIGVEPVDLGGLGNAQIIEPGGALWGKALSQVEMLEAVGWLSGDG
ncbi:MAG TPA: hypothetical protein VF461_23935 [Gemmatimonadaceae bacterium]